MKKDTTSVIHGKITDTVIVNFCNKIGVAESHNTMYDIHIIKKGEETLLVGGKISGITSPQDDWEVRGESIVGGKEYYLKKGDILTIPAGVPHQHIGGTGRKKVLKVIPYSL